MSRQNRCTLILVLLVAILLTGCFGGGWKNTGLLTIELGDGGPTAVTQELFLSNDQGQSLFLPLGGSSRASFKVPQGTWYLWGYARDPQGRVVAVSSEFVVRGGHTEVLNILMTGRTDQPVQPRVADLSWTWVGDKALLSWALETGVTTPPGKWQVWRSRSDGPLWEKIGQVPFERTDFSDSPNKLGVLKYGIRYVEDDPRTSWYPGPFVEGSPPVPGGIEVTWEFKHEFPLVSQRYLSLAAAVDSSPEPEFADLVVHFTSSWAFDNRQSLLDDVGLEIKREIPTLFAVLVEPRWDSERSLEEWSSFAGPDFYVEPNWHVRADSLGAAQVSFVPWYLSYLRVPQAQSLTKGSQSVRIAVVDTGLNKSALPNSVKVLPGYNFVSSALDPTDTRDDYSGVYHGTRVARLISEVMPYVSIQPIKVLDSGGDGTAFDVAEGILYAAGLHYSLPNTNPAHIINLSLGQPGPAADVLEDAVKQVASKTGVLMIAAAGNDYKNGLRYPAAYPEVIAVGSVICDGYPYRAAYSNYGRGLDLVGPEEYWQGTSFSTALVSGVAGLMLANGTSAHAIRSGLAATAIDLGVTGWDEHHGHGLVNAEWAVQNVDGFTLTVYNLWHEVVWEQKVPLQGEPLIIDLPPGDYMVQGRLNNYEGRSPVVSVTAGYGERVQLILEERL
mgnify:CR=1 FL=1